MSLFLYLDVDTGLTLLREARLPFLQVGQLADPFLSNHAVREVSSRRRVSQQEIEAEIRRQYQALPEHLAGLVTFDYFREQALAKRDQLEARLLAQAPQVRIDLPTDAQRQSLCLLRMFSSAANPMLWEHHGDGHRGMVIELDTQDETLSGRTYRDKPQLLQAVSYGDERPLADPNLPFQALFHRSRAYAAEGEWRLLRPCAVADKVVERGGRTLYLHKIAPRALRRMVLGCNLDGEEQRRILGLLAHDRRYGHLEIQACCIDPQRFEMHFRPLSREP